MNARVVSAYTLSDHKRTAGERDRLWVRVFEDEPQRRSFRPVTVVTTRRIRRGKEGAVSTMLRLDESNFRVRRNGVTRSLNQPHERIVQRMQNQSRHRNAIQHPRRSSAVIIIIRRLKP